MKKFLFRLIIFAVTGFFAQFVIYILIKKALDAKSNFRVTRYFRSPKHQYFVLGNSRGVNSISEKYATENLKLDLINLSFNGEPYKNIVNMLDDINSKNQHVNIFIEISCIGNLGFDNSYAYYISNSKFLKKQFEGSVYSWIDLLRLNNEILLRNIYYLKKSDNDWINGNTITPNIINHIKADSSIQVFANKTLCYGRLDELNQKCSVHHNKLFFFMAPYYPAYLSKVADYKSIITYMRNNSAKYNFVDLNTVPLNNNMFADRVHTNTKGAVPLTNNLINLSKIK